MSPSNDHAAALTELLGLVDERYQAALRAGVADIERLDRAERLQINMEPPWWRCGAFAEGQWRAYSPIIRKGHYAPTLRAAIDEVRG